MIDVDVLKTLPRRELTAGFCEAVKQGAIADRKLFEQTAEFLQNYSPQKFKKYLCPSEIFLKNWKNLSPRKSLSKRKSSARTKGKILTEATKNRVKSSISGIPSAHALEKVTAYKHFKHGEAVGYGILFAAEISKDVAKFVQDELKLLNDVVRLTGNLPITRNIEIEDIIRAVSFDKKSIGESLQWILLEKIGKPKIFSDRDIPRAVIEKSLKKILKTESNL